MKEKIELPSIQKELEYMKWVAKKRKMLRALIIKNKIKSFYLFNTKEESKNLPFNKDYYL
jgi:hypothetical protein